MAGLTAWTYLLGRHLNATVTPLLVNEATGAVTESPLQVQNGAPGTLGGFLDRATARVRRQVENISHIGSFWENNVPIQAGMQIELTQILDASGRRNFLAACSSYYAVQVVITRGSAGAWTIIGTVEGYEERYERGKNVGTLTLVPVHIAPAA